MIVRQPFQADPILPVWHEPGKRRQPGKAGLQFCIEPALKD